MEEPIELESGEELSPSSMDSEDINRWLDDMDGGIIAGAPGTEGQGDGSDVPDCFFDSGEEQEDGEGQEESAPKRASAESVQSTSRGARLGHRHHGCACGLRFGLVTGSSSI